MSLQFYFVFFSLYYGKQTRHNYNTFFMDSFVALLFFLCVQVARLLYIGDWCSVEFLFVL